jgi:hypothetical protein
LEKAQADWSMPLQLQLQLGEALTLALPEHSTSRATDHIDNRPMS